MRDPVMACGCDCHYIDPALGGHPRDGTTTHCGRCRPTEQPTSAPFAILRVEFTDADDVGLFGVSQLGAWVAEELGDTNITYKVELVEVSGPDAPAECLRCGCAYHGPPPCPTCPHVLCQLGAQ